ncbi:MAG: TonB-dependent receptor [Acidobacteria bacterium]|nr:TonB-dependent receptor [Acidobacteriota bacterium]
MMILRSLFTVLLLGCTPAFVWGQAVTATLVGTITDASGAVVVNTKVSATETNTGVSRIATTNESGNYSFTNLPPGTYSVTAEQTGFKKAARAGVDVIVNATTRVDLTLTPGQITETVEVTAETALLQTDRADVGRKIETAQLANLPTGYNRSFQSLLNLVPGTTRAFAPHSEFFNSQGSLATQVNGVSRLGNNVQFEGVDNNHRTGLLTILIPPIEAIQNVDVSTSNYEAELGRAGGAVTNVILKSGTNNLHGGLYEFHNNSHLNARETFQPSKPVTTYNYFGGNVGGAIIKNKTFFFGDYLRIADRRGDGFIITVPSDTFRSGDFSTQAARVYDPATGDRITGAGRTPFPDNKIPTSRISPIATKLLSFVPVPNINNNLINNYASSTTRKKDQDSFDVKVDHQQSDKNRFSVRYSFQRPVVTDPGRFGIYGGGGKGFAATGINRTQSAAVNYTRLLSPTFITEARIGVGRYSNRAENLDIGTNASDAVGIKGANLDRWSSGLSSINVGGYPNPLVGYTASIPWNRAETNIDLVSNWTKIQSNHTVKFGVDVRRLRDELLQTQDAGGPRGEFIFGNNQTSTSGASVQAQVNGLASFLLDTPSQVQRDLAVLFPAYRAFMVFSYLQDKWQVSQKLTIDLGLRHDFYPPATPRLKGGFSNYDPGTNSLVVAGYGNNPMNLGRTTYYTGFAPRIGLAYRLDPKTVLRAGFGLSWIPFPDNQYAYNFPIKQTNAYPNTNTFGQSQSPTGSFLSMATGFPAPTTAAIPDNGIISAGSGGLLSSVFNTIPKDYREGYIITWNMALQRQLPKNFTIEAAYVANHTVRAPATYNLNASLLFNSGSNGKPLFRQFNKNTDVNYRYTGVSNNYNSLQVKLDRRFHGGFQMTTAYTLGHALGMSSEDGGLWNYIQQRRGYARLDFDRRHTFVQSYVYEFPFGKGKPYLTSGVGRWVAGGWQVNGVLSLMTGRPLTLGTNVSANTPGSSITPDLKSEINITHAVAGTAGTATWFDTTGCVPVVTASCFVQQPLDADGRTPHFGNLGRNAFTGPGLGNLDFSIFRKFEITERVKLEFRAESTNVTNSPAFGNPNTTLGDANFGKITGTLAGLVTNQGVGGTGPRAVNLGLKLTF